MENGSIFRPFARMYGITDENQTDFALPNTSYALGFDHPIGPPRRLGRDDNYSGSRRFRSPLGVIEHFLLGLECL